jgi:hypothetical protein
MKKFIYLLITIIIVGCKLNLVKNNNTINKKINYSFPIYGNYCGDFPMLLSSNLIPIDQVDNACKKFALCQVRFSKNNFDCYISLREEILDIIPSNSSEKLAKKLIIAYLNNKGF